MVEGVRAVIFDWAGTMIDFGSVAPVAAMQAAFSGQGITVTAAQVRVHMGKAKRDHVAAIAADVGAAFAVVDPVYTALEPLMAEVAAQHTVLVPGAAEVAADLQARGIKIGSCTGYTPAMMAGILPRAAEQGYRPDCVVCAGDTLEGRPSPLMLWKNLVELGIWPAHHVVKVDDAAVGIEEGHNAGCWTVAVIASGNSVGLSLHEFQALDAEAKNATLAAARADMQRANPHYIIDTVAELPAVIDMVERSIAQGVLPFAADRSEQLGKNP